MQSYDPTKYTKATGLVLAISAAGLLQLMESGQQIASDQVIFHLPIASYAWLAVFGGSFVAADGVSRWMNGPKDLAAKIAKIGVVIMAVALFIFNILTNGQTSIALFEELYRLISGGDTLMAFDGELVPGSTMLDGSAPAQNVQIFLKLFSPLALIPALFPALFGFGLSKALRIQPMASESD